MPELEFDTQPNKIPKTALRDELYHHLLELILSGELEPSSRVRETRLSETLGVSRTPMREALFKLEREGFLRQDLAKGFSVQPLSEREVREIYPILWTLEGLALRLAGKMAALELPTLNQINHELAQAKDAQSWRKWDTQFHETLVKNCGNTRLLELIQYHRQLVARYERAYMQNLELVAVSAQQHQQILISLELGDVEAAAVALEGNWQYGIQALLVFLQS
jgi:DNA-binding GntR family transcriptional regulator